MLQPVWNETPRRLSESVVKCPDYNLGSMLHLEGLYSECLGGADSITEVVEPHVTPSRVVLVIEALVYWWQLSWIYHVLLRVIRRKLWICTFRLAVGRFLVFKHSESTIFKSILKDTEQIMNKLTNSDRSASRSSCPTRSILKAPLLRFGYA